MSEKLVVNTVVGFSYIVRLPNHSYGDGATLWKGRQILILLNGVSQDLMSFYNLYAKRISHFALVFNN